MFNELFVTIAAGVISALPVQPIPAVVVSTGDVESSVVQYIEINENREVTIDCSFHLPEIAVEDEQTREFICTTTDVKNKQKFKTVVTLAAQDEKVSISASMSSNSKTPKKAVAPPIPSPTPTPVKEK